jgi:hypothetical protein
MCGFIFDSRKVKSICELFEEAANLATRRKNMSRVHSEEELSTIDQAMEEVTPIEYQLRRGACLMLKKGLLV